MKKIIHLILILLLASPAWAVVYYVDCNAANDSGAGTSTGTAWKTINKVNHSSFSAGDSILFNKGCTWREMLTVPVSGSAGNVITFGVYGSGALPIISGSDVMPTGFFALTTSPAYTNVWYVSGVTTEPKIVLFNSTVGTHVASASACTAAYNWFWGSNVLYVYSTSNPDTVYTSPGVQVGQRDAAIYQSAKNYITYSNLNLRNTSHYGLYADGGSNTITVSGCTLSQNYQSGMQTAAGTTNDNWTVQNNTVSYNQGYGLALSWFSHGTVKNNTVNYNSSSADFGYKAGVKMTGDATLAETHSNTIQSNNTSNNYGAGIWMDFCGAGNIIRYNLSSSNGDYGIKNEITSSSQIYYNLVTGNANSGIWIEGRNGTDSSNAPANSNVVYNNTVYGNTGFGILLQNGDNIQGNTHSNLIKNNIVGGTITGPELRVGGKAELESNTITYNSFGVARTSFIEWGWGTYKSTYAAFYSAYAGANGNTVETDPVFVSAAGGNFRLTSASPAKEAGVAVGLYRDVINTVVPLGAGIDMGAYEFGIGVEWHGLTGHGYKLK